MNPPRPAPPRPGEVIYLDRAASVQFIRPITVRVIRVLDWPTYDGWCWLEGYQLDPNGDAVDRRRLFVQVAGVQRVPSTTPTTTPSARRPAAIRQPSMQANRAARTATRR